MKEQVCFLRKRIRVFTGVLGASLFWTSVAVAQPPLSLDVATRNQLAAAAAAFRAEMAAKAAAADKSYDSVVQGKDGWLFFVPEMRHVSVGKFWGAEAKKVSRSVKPENADPLDAILDFKAQLEKVGVKLLLVPVPPKSVIYADKISAIVPTPLHDPNADRDAILPRLDTAHREFYELLREKGVRVLDLTEPFLKDRGLDGLAPETGQKFHYPTYTKQDTHWSPYGISIAASLIEREIQNSFVRSKAKYTNQSKTLRIKGDLWDALPAEVKRPQQELVLANYVRTLDPKNKSTLVPVGTSRNSPVLLLGDSHTLVFHEGGDMHAKGAGLPDLLAYYLGYPVDLIGVRGSGATPARTSLLRLARANPNYLKNKKWVVWCFSAREFTESAGWSKVPVVK